MPRTRTHAVVALIAAAAAAFALPVAARATTYTYVDLGPGPNGNAAYAYGATSTQQAGYYLFERLSCGKACSFPVYHAVTWAGAGSKPVDITPPLSYFPEAWAYGAAGTVIAGVGITNNAGYFGVPHALVWHGSPMVWTDVNPIAGGVSYAYGTDGFNIVGSAAGTALHAMRWQLGHLQHPTDLQPPSGYVASEAYGDKGKFQVGYAMTASSPSVPHAMLWLGTAGSAVDLTPSTVSRAFAYGTDGNSQIGYGLHGSNDNHALWWHGSASRMVDLHPPGFVDSYGRAVLGAVQAGYGHNASNLLNALVWNGTAKSAFDLQSVLPSSYTQSEAFGMDAKGDIIGAALYGGAIWHAVVWVPGPAAGVAGSLVRR